MCVGVRGVCACVREGVGVASDSDGTVEKDRKRIYTCLKQAKLQEAIETMGKHKKPADAIGKHSKQTIENHKKTGNHRKH